MYNNKNKEDRKSPGAAGPPPPSPPPPPMSPRISFSNDFVEEPPTSHHSQSHQQIVRKYRDAPVSSDFEFSVSNYSMNMSADELFSHGRLLPLKESIFRKKPTRATTTTTTTLRDELEVVDDYEDDDDDDLGFSLRPPRNTCTRWKGFLGLRKSHIGSKKIDTTSHGSAHQRSASLPDFVLSSKASQDKNLNEGSSHSMNVEFRH